MTTPTHRLRWLFLALVAGVLASCGGPTPTRNDCHSFLGKVYDVRVFGEAFGDGVLSVTAGPDDGDVVIVVSVSLDGRKQVFRSTAAVCEGTTLNARILPSQEGEVHVLDGNVVVFFPSEINPELTGYWAVTVLGVTEATRKVSGRTLRGHVHERIDKLGHGTP